ncbi:MAG: 3-hydroxyacyl-CoA dehydrogenase [uncultured archaeon A07HB70]|nr:MAG: 3-hydroxyacyl-CoA dehydrogenase [uncultured archaeon A07HB70]
MPETLDRPVAVVGAGTMGAGLAVQFARHGARVALVDHREANLDDARTAVRDATAALDDRGLLAADPGATRDRVDYTLDLADACEGVALVLESVSEDIEAKAAVFATAADATDDAVLATNTSSLAVTEVADRVPDEADRVVGCHWWNPPYLLPTVEVVAGDATSDETVERTAALVEAVDREPIRVRRDVPGFVWNRVQFAVLRECAHIVETGVATPADVDRAVRDGYALRTAAVGPFETVDLSSLSLFRTIAAGIYPSLSDADEPGAAFDDRIDAGRAGVAAGAGFHDYDESAREAVRRRDERVAALRAAQEETRSREDANADPDPS